MRDKKESKPALRVLRLGEPKVKWRERAAADGDDLRRQGEEGGQPRRRRRRGNLARPGGCERRRLAVRRRRGRLAAAALEHERLELAPGAGPCAPPAHGRLLPARGHPDLEREVRVHHRLHARHRQVDRVAHGIDAAPLQPRLHLLQLGDDLA